MSWFEKYFDAIPDPSNILLINLLKTKIKNILNEKINMNPINFVNLNEEYLIPYYQNKFNINKILKKIIKYYREDIVIKEFLYSLIFKESCIYYALVLNIFIGQIFNRTKWNIFRDNILKFTNIYSFIEIESNLTNNKLTQIINNYNNGMNNQYKINNVNNLLRKVYGEVILKKGSILYHTSDEDKKFEKMYESEKPFLFCTFHPSEFGETSTMITRVRLKKDISLFFMINSIYKIRIESELKKLIPHENNNLSKQNIDILKCVSKYLKKDNFDGWFSSIENKKEIEAALINSNEIFETLPTESRIKNWRNSMDDKDGKKIPKDWGQLYSICSIENPIIFNINLRYKQLIKNYLDFEKKSGYINEVTFQIILKNAIINYHENAYQNIEFIC